LEQDWIQYVFDSVYQYTSGLVKRWRPVIRVSFHFWAISCVL